MRNAVCWALVLLLSTAAELAAEQRLTLNVQAGNHDRQHTPLRVLLTLAADLADEQTASLALPDGKVISGQLTAPGLLADARNVLDGKVRRELHFILPELKAGQSLAIEASIPAAKKPATVFAWQDTPGEYAELSLGNSTRRPVLRYMYKALDESTPQARELTYKPFHHLYDPSGQRLVTKGPGGLYTHHRGLYFGFNRISYDGGQKLADVWHARGDAFQSHEELLSSEAGAVLGRHRVAIDWHGVGKAVFAREEREMTVYNVPGGQLVEFAAVLRTADGPVKLDGDPQHAGFHFRAAQEVAEKTKGQTYYLRPSGQGKPGETRNWPQAKDHVNLPFNAMSFVLGEQRYTAGYLDKPTNPKEARFSERDYGRFGSYFEYEVTAERPLEVNYRLWLQAGEMTGEQLAAKSADFVEPPQATVAGQ